VGGLKFSFDFSGPNTGTAFVPVTGTWSVTDPVTNIQLVFTGGDAFILPAVHELTLSGTCAITTPDGGTLPGTCDLLACDAASNGAVDEVSFDGVSAEAEIKTIPGAGDCGNQLASGNLNID